MCVYEYGVFGGSVSPESPRGQVLIDSTGGLSSSINSIAVF